MKPTTYKSVKGSLLIAVNALMLAMFIFFIVKQIWPAAVIFGLVNGLLLWVWLDTYYTIKDDQLFYKNAFISGSVPIGLIHEIEKHNKGVVMCSAKASLALTGLIIKYNRWDDLFISPENEEQFIADLQKINPEIKVS